MASKKVLFISGSFGLGHVSRDLAIVHELRSLIPDVNVSWLASSPAADVILGAGEKLLPEAAQWAQESALAEGAAQAGSFRLNVLSFLMKTRKEWKRNVEVFKKVTEGEHYDLVVGDETYEISVALKKDPTLKKSPVAVLYDFIGMDAMSKNVMERAGVYIWNRIWSKKYKKAEGLFDAVLFVGEPEDIPDRSFGLFLPNRRVWAEYRALRYTGYIFPFNPADYADKAKARSALGYGPEPLVICSIGGTAVGKELLELCGKSFPILRKDIPGLRMVLVCGPRLNPDLPDLPEGIIVKGYVPKLYEHLAACDLAVVQGGGTATLELTALRRPFLYFPLENHCEQQVTVAGRLARHGAGFKMNFSETTPESLARAIAANIGREASWPPIPVAGARAAALILRDLLDRGRGPRLPGDHFPRYSPVS